MEVVHETGKSEHVRLFIAVPAPVETITAVEHFRNINGSLIGTRWVYEENYHLTILFLGDVNFRDIPEVNEILAHALNDFSASRLNFDRYSLEGGKKPSMVWARYQKNDSFSSQAATLRQKLAFLAPGISRFVDPVPHITLARIRSGVPPDLNGANDLPAVSLKGYELWQTCRIKEGVRYKSLGKYYLSLT